MTIRVLRVLEYEYDDGERMAKDMAAWTLQGNRDFGTMRIRSFSCTPIHIDGESDYWRGWRAAMDAIAEPQTKPGVSSG